MINNSCESFGKNGDIKIDLTVYAEPRGGLGIEIKDHGKGIGPADLEALQHSDSSIGKGHLTEKGEGGFGLGLSFVKRELTRISGTLEIGSEVNRGNHN